MKEWLVRNVCKNMILITFVRIGAVMSVYPLIKYLGVWPGLLAFLFIGMAVELWRIWAQGFMDTLKLVADIIKMRKAQKKAAKGAV